MDNIKKGLGDIAYLVTNLSYDAAMIISIESGINNPTSMAKSASKEKKQQLKKDISEVIDMLETLKNTF